MVERTRTTNKREIRTETYPFLINNLLIRCIFSSGLGNFFICNFEEKRHIISKYSIVDSLKKIIEVKKCDVY